MYLVDPNQAYSSSQGASALLGKIHRAQWQDWKARFAPKIKELAGMAKDEGLPEEMAQQASETVGQSFDNAKKSLSLQQASLGMHLTDDEREVQERKFSLAEAAGRVEASNSARSGTKDLQQNILMGGGGLKSLPSEVIQNL